MNKPSRRWIVLGALILVVIGGYLTWRARATSAAEPAAASPAASTQRAALTVNITSPVLQTWPTLLLADGHLAAWQEAVIGAEVGSLRITELHADVGKTVKRGDLLARLSDASLKANIDKQRAAVSQARANLTQAQSNVARARSVSSSGVLSGQRIDEYAITEATTRAALASAEADLRSSEIQLGQTRIVAVDDGLISSRTALLGNVVAAGAELFRLVRQGKIEWRAEVDAARLASLHPGQSARITLPTGKQLDGTVRLVGPTLSTNTNRAVVFVSLPPNSGAQQGMFASGTIEGAATPALTLPQSAIVLRDGRSDIYLLKEDSTVTRRTVLTGRRVGDRIEVLSQLDAHVQVVADGGAFLGEGVKVEPVNGADGIQKSALSQSGREVTR